MATGVALPVLELDLAACAFFAGAAWFEERVVEAMELEMRWESASWTQLTHHLGTAVCPRAGGMKVPE
jgi:hypothetical protein